MICVLALYSMNINIGNTKDDAIPKIASSEQKFSVDECWNPNLKLFDSIKLTTANSK